MEGVQQRRFRIHHGLGRGGYGEVYKATMTSPGGLRADVAVKLLRLDQHADEDAVRRLRDEGKLLAALQHPTILRVYDLAVLEGRIGLVTEYVDGQDLRGCLDADPPLPLRPLVEVVGLVAEGLYAAYEALAPETGEPMRLVHRDVKPSNLRLSRHGEVKILDFGIARSDSVEREARTGSQATLGSLAYMSPERFDARAPGPEGDVFSLGCVLFEGLSGHRFYPEAVPVHMYRMAASLKSYKAHLERAMAEIEGRPAEVVALVRDMLAHDPDERVVARDVATRCEALVDQLEGLSLKRWARERTWPEAALVSTSFDGRTLTDGTLRTGAFAASWLPSVPDSSETLQFDNLITEEMTGGSSVGEAPSPDDVPTEQGRDMPPRRRSAVPLLIGGIAVVLLLGALSVYVSRQMGGPPTPEPVPQPEPLVQPEPVPAPVPEPVAAPEPAAVALPEPAPEPQPQPQPVVPPKPAAPKPAPAPVPMARPIPDPVPAPTPKVAPDGTVQVEGATLVKLVGAKGRSFTTPTVPGGAYTAHIDFGSHTTEVRVVVPPKGRVNIVCNRLTSACVPEQ